MVRWGQTLCWAALVGVVAMAPACKKDKKSQAKPKPAAAKPIPPPKQVMVYLGLRNPGKSLDEGLALVREFVPLPFNRSGLLDLFAQRAKLPREVMAAIDINKPLWVIGMDQAQVGTDPDPLLMVLPITSRKDFERALTKKLRKSGTEGKLTLYTPKPGAVGNHPAKLHFTKDHVWAASSSKAFEIARPFVAGSLLPRPPKHDVAIHLAVENILKVRGDDLDRKVDQAMDQMRTGAKRSEGPIDKQQVAGATERAVRRWVEALRSTREAQILVDVNREQLTLAVRALASQKGRLARLIKRQRPGTPFGYELLPSSSWLVLSDHSNPEAQAEDIKTWEPMLKQLLKGLAVQKQAALVKAVTEAAAVFTGDFTVALHRAPAGNGLTCSMVSRVKDQDAALKMLDNVASSLGDWIKAVIARSKDEVPQGVRVERKEFAEGKAKGALFQLHLKLPQDKRAQVEAVVGLPITLGVAFVGEYGLLSLGKGAAEQLQTLARGADTKPEQGLTKNKAFMRALEAGNGRVGLLYFSLVDLVRWFEGTGMKELETIAAALKDQTVASAPSVDWSAEKDQGAFDVTLRLPSEHFRVFKPILAEIRKRGLFGARRQPKWKDF